MPTLNRDHRRFIVKKLACGADPDEVAAAVKERFLIDISSGEVAQHYPDALAKLFFETREEYRADQERAAARRTTFVKVTTMSELEDQPMLCVEKKDTQIALFKQGGEVYALNNTCTHQGGPLCEGSLTEGEVECPWHGSRFALDTGEATEAPATEAVARYAVRVRSEDVEVKL